MTGPRMFEPASLSDRRERALRLRRFRLLRTQHLIDQLLACLEDMDEVAESPRGMTLRPHEAPTQPPGSGPW